MLRIRLGSSLSPLPLFSSHSPRSLSKFQYPHYVGQMRGKTKNHARKKDMWPHDSDHDDFYDSNSSSSVELSMTYPMTRKFSSAGMSAFHKEKEKERIKPRNPHQADYMNLLDMDAPAIVLAIGPAGTGKTMIACHVGLRKLVNGEITKMILTRPAVSVEEQHGFLPGTLEEKMEPWLKPIYDIMYQYFSVPKVQQLIKNQIIEICPLAYMRGRTFENAWIIADEAQNMTPNQMLMLLTRIGHKSKMIITGDPAQHDRGFEVNGLNDLLKRMRRYRENKIGLVHFTENDVERHPIIKSVLKLYKDQKKSTSVHNEIVIDFTSSRDGDNDDDIDDDDQIVGEIELEENIDTVKEIVKEILDNSNKPNTLSES